MTLRSHTEAEILAAYREGEMICVLDSNGHGKDDVLIGEIIDCNIDVIEHEERDVFEEEGWTLSEIGEEDEPLKNIIEAEQ